MFESNFALDFFPTSNYRSNKKKICILEPKTTEKKRVKEGDKQYSKLNDRMTIKKFIKRKKKKKTIP